MRLILQCLLALPLSAATFTLVNLSNQDLDELELFEQRENIIKQVRDLYIAGASGTHTFDVAAEVCLELQAQLKTDNPIRSVIRADDHTAPCRVDLSGEKARIMWDGWDWNEPVGGDGTIRTVCASGCDHTTVQAAVDVAVLGDLILLTAGEEFGDDTVGTVLNLPSNHDFQGNCPTYTVIRPTNHSANFTRGVRVTASDASNMANLIGGDTGAGTNIHPVRITTIKNGETANVTAVDTSTEQITTASAHGFSVGDKLVWTQRATSDYRWIDGDDFFHTRYYYALTTPTTTTLTLSEALGGSTVDITTTPTNLSNAGLRKANRPIACWKLQGLEIEVSDSDAAGQNIISMYDFTPFPETKVSHIIFEHLYLHGYDNNFGPKRGIVIAGRYIAFRDSLITEITDYGSQESQGIFIVDAPGPVWIENNGVMAAGENFLTNPSNGRPEYIDIGSLGGITQRNNYYWKKDEWYVQAIAGAPSGTCHTGAQWKDTSAGPTCYTCTAGVWGSADANCDNYIDYIIKNLWESKSCSGCLTENFWGDLSPFGDGSQQAWAVSKVGANSWTGWDGANDTVFHNFRSRYTAGGPAIRGVVQPMTSKENGPTVFWNGLSTHVDPSLYNQSDGLDAIRVLNLGAIDLGFEIRHLTQLGFTTTTVKESFVAEPQETTPDSRTDWFSIRDSIIQTTRFNSAPSTAGCDTLNGAVSSPFTPYVENNVFIDAGVLDHSGCATVTYTESSLNDVGFANVANSDFRITGAGTTNDYRAGQAEDASDGKDMGVDFEMLDDALGGTDPTAGLGSWSSQYGVAITAISATSATVEFDRPASNSCDLTLYTNYARTTEHGDTNTAGEKADTRAGNDITADHVTFNLGTNTALTAGTHYWFEIDCATDSVLMVGALMTAE